MAEAIILGFGKTRLLFGDWAETEVWKAIRVIGIG
jgi:hypothetical protein